MSGIDDNIFRPVGCHSGPVFIRSYWYRKEANFFSRTKLEDSLWPRQPVRFRNNTSKYQLVVSYWKNPDWNCPDFPGYLKMTAYRIVKRTETLENTNRKNSTTNWERASVHFWWSHQISCDVGDIMDRVYYSIRAKRHLLLNFLKNERTGCPYSREERYSSWIQKSARSQLERCPRYEQNQTVHVNGIFTMKHTLGGYIFSRRCIH